jgi:hypothetical protein
MEPVRILEPPALTFPGLQKLQTAALGRLTSDPSKLQFPCILRSLIVSDRDN